MQTLEKELGYRIQCLIEMTKQKGVVFSNKNQRILRNQRKRTITKDLKNFGLDMNEAKDSKVMSKECRKRASKSSSSSLIFFR